VVEEGVDVDVGGGVDEGAGVAGDFGVVAFAVEVEGGLLGVGGPVYVCVWRLKRGGSVCELGCWNGIDDSFCLIIMI
jgi:hypothetical protein